jgi:hypothetical protein
MGKAPTTKAKLEANEVERYRQFVESAAAQHKVWGLWRDGWALGKNAEGKLVFPLWPDKDKAQPCAVGPWKGFEPEEIPVEDLLDQLLPQLAKDDVSASVFPPPGESGGPTPSIATLISDLESALGRDDDVD